MTAPCDLCLYRHESTLCPQPFRQSHNTYRVRLGYEYLGFGSLLHLNHEGDLLTSFQAVHQPRTHPVGHVIAHEGDGKYLIGILDHSVTPSYKEEMKRLRDLIQEAYQAGLNFGPREALRILAQEVEKN